MKNSIFAKIFWSYFFIIIFTALFLFAFSFNLVKKSHIKTTSGNLKKLAMALSPEIAPFLEKRDYSALDQTVKKLGKRIGVRITVVLPDGKVVADSEKEPELMENHKNRPELLEASVKGYGTSIRYSATVGEEMLYVALPLTTGKGFEGFLRISVFLREINSFLTNMKKRLLISVVLITFLALIGALFVAKSLSRPVVQLAEASEKIAQGNFDVTVENFGKDEIGVLASSFNNMAERLRELFGKLKMNEEELTNLISSMSEALMVVDAEGKITLANNAFEDFFGNNVKGRFFYEVIRDYGFSDFLDKARKGKADFAEVKISDKTFLCSVSKVKSKNELLVILRDISELKKLEKIKKDFVINASHELRTPLTAIKGYLETLEDMVEEEGKNYLQIVLNNTERLSNIVNDLLLLSETEEKGLKAPLDKVYLERMLSEIVSMFKVKAEKKGLKIVFESNAKGCFVEGDAFKLEQVFINLIDNAVKYTDKGEVKIVVDRGEKGVEVKVGDTGIGIPEKYLDRIFERFFVVDKSRSKKTGGTGLGLSIVKHIVMLHKGEIKVESAKNKGTVFTVFLPYSPE